MRKLKGHLTHMEGLDKIYKIFKLEFRGNCLEISGVCESIILTLVFHIITVNPLKPRGKCIYHQL